MVPAVGPGRKPPGLLADQQGYEGTGDVYHQDASGRVTVTSFCGAAAVASLAIGGPVAGAAVTVGLDGLAAFTEQNARRPSAKPTTRVSRQG
jgi:hypothetical protein